MLAALMLDESKLSALLEFYFSGFSNYQYEIHMNKNPLHVRNSLSVK
jgi:hypothetical protein